MPSYVVTGASRGIGREFVRQLSANDANVVFALIRSKSTSKQLLEMAEQKSNIHVLMADITDYKALKQAAADVSKITGGKLDVLINNAAYVDGGVKQGYALDGYPEGHEAELEADFRKTFDINVIGVIHTTNIFLPLLKAGSLKKVISISSGIGDLDLTLKTGFDTHVPYCVSKAAMNMVVAKYAAEYEGTGFSFLALSPGLVATSETPPSKEELEIIMAMGEKFKKLVPEVVPLTPEVSVKMQLDVIDKLTPAQSGAFLSHYGNKQWL